MRPIDIANEIAVAFETNEADALKAFLRYPKNKIPLLAILVSKSLPSRRRATWERRLEQAYHEAASEERPAPDRGKPSSLPTNSGAAVSVPQQDLEPFADMVLRAARRVPTQETYGDNKVFIDAVYRDLKRSGLRADPVEFKDWLINEQ